MKTKIAVIKCLLLLVPTLCFGADTSILVRGEKFETDVWVSEPIYRYQSLGFPKKLTKQILQTSLQEYHNQYHGKTFRFMGDWRDFDHGHLINDELSLRAVLFHTQERANIAPRGSAYTYVNKELRNWLFFIENPTTFKNALTFRYDHKPEFWSRMYDKNVTWAEYEQAGTVVEMMLDPGK